MPVQEERAWQRTTWFGLGRTCRLCGNFDLQPRSPQRDRKIQHLSGGTLLLGRADLLVKRVPPPRWCGRGRRPGNKPHHGYATNKRKLTHEWQACRGQQSVTQIKSLPPSTHTLLSSERQWLFVPSFPKNLEKKKFQRDVLRGGPLDAAEAGAYRGRPVTMSVRFWTPGDMWKPQCKHTPSHHASLAPAARARHLLLMLRSMGFRLAA